MLEYTEYVKIFIGLVAVVNPIGAVPLFISLTSNQSIDERLRTGSKMVFGVGCILLVALFFGEVLLQLFGITINSFRVGGGILILLMAISMLHAKTSSLSGTDAEASESIDKESVGIVPLAMPMLAGPGAISAVILAAQKAQGPGHYVTIAGGILLLAAILWIVIRLSPWITSRISATGINVFTRIMGLILAAIAIEFIANGLKGLFPILARTS